MGHTKSWCSFGPARTQHHLGPAGGGGGGMGVLDPEIGTLIGVLPGSNPCSCLYNRVKYMGQNSTFRENVGGKNSTFRKILGSKLYIQENIGVHILHILWITLFPPNSEFQVPSYVSIKFRFKFQDFSDKYMSEFTWYSQLFVCCVFDLIYLGKINTWIKKHRG